MDFNIELTKFPSAVHSNIYSFARHVMPLSLTINAVSDPDMRASCVALHGFMMDMLSDMYDNPEAYYLPVLKLENFFGDRIPLDVMREAPDKFKRVFVQTSHTASQYEHLLFWIGYGGTLDNDSIIISAGRLQDISKRVSTNTSPIKLNKRMEALNRVGLELEISPTGKGRFTSKKYPKMFLALHVIAGFLDFRKINGEYNPEKEDYFYPLLTKEREIANALHDYAIERKMRFTPNANKGIDYKYKNKQVMCIGTGNDLECFLSVKVMGKDRKDDIAVIDGYLKNESEINREHARQHLTGCDANQCIMCSTYYSGKYVTVLGKNHQMCGTGVIAYNWHRPVKADITIIKRLIEIRCNMID